MKIPILKTFCTLIMVLFVHLSYSQNQQILEETLPANSKYNWKVTKSGNFYTVEIKNQTDASKTKSFTIAPLKEEIFRNGYEQALNELEIQPANLFEEAHDLFMKIYAAESLADEQKLIAGYLDVEDTVFYFEDPKLISKEIEDRRNVINHAGSNRENNINLLKETQEVLSNRKTDLSNKASELKIKLKENERLINESANDSLAKLKLEQYKAILKDSLTTTNEEIKTTDGQIKTTAVALKAQIMKNCLLVQNVQLQIEDGAIENIYVVCKDALTGTEIHFKNSFPISFSKIYDFRMPSEIILYSNSSWTAGSPKLLCILLTDLIKYRPNLFLQSKNYSPENSVHVLIPPVNDYKVYKEETSKILKAIVYSDLIGLGKNQPNGIIQTEVSKKIYMITRKIWWHNNAAQFLNFGVFNFIEPNIGISKLEESNSAALLKNRYYISPTGLITTKYLSTLDVLQYQNFKAGATLNIFNINFAPILSTFGFNFRAQFGRTTVIDSIKVLTGGVVNTTGSVESYNINTFQYIPEFTWLIKPDPRFNVTSGCFLNFMFTKSKSNILEISNIEQYEKYGTIAKSNNYILSFFLQANLKTGLHIEDNLRTDQSKGEFFFRMSYNYLVSDKVQNFIQAQLGYSFNLLKKN